MKLSVPRLTARALGEPLQPGKQIIRSLNTSPIPRTHIQTRSWRPCHQYNSQPTRHNSNNAPTSQTKAQTSATKTSPSKSSTTQFKNSPASSISENVRLLMRRVPYPVAIITSTDPTGPPDTSSFRGMTVSSFNTVTLTPHPVISFNVRRPSETLNALLASGRFLVHLLAPRPETATLARDFSKGNATLVGMLSGHGDFEFGALDVSPNEAAGEDRSIDSGVRSADRPLPVLRRRDSKESEDSDFPFILECVLHPSKIDVHDHSVILGTVVRVMEGSDLGQVHSAQGQAADSLCLTYANTKFWKMGEEI